MDWNKLFFEIAFLLLTSLFNYFEIPLGTSDWKNILPTQETKVSPAVTPVLGTTTSGVLVTRVIDGDTLQIQDGRKVRLIGIDAPEKKGIECYSNESSKYLESLVLGQSVTLEKDVSETDRYGRLLRYVYKDSASINETLISEGYAFALTYPPDVKYSVKFKIAEKSAKDFKKGLWGGCNN